jgi:hypothetical protein
LAGNERGEIMTPWEINELAEEMWRELKNQTPNSPIEYIKIALTIVAKKGFKDAISDANSGKQQPFEYDPTWHPMKR